jgi:predicted AAA+ superfamily ATPase
MIKRDITTELIASAEEYPVVTVFGPRQSGKTTLAQMTFPHKSYYSLENPDIRMAAKTDPRGFLANFPDGGVLDEIQRLPQLLSYIQGIVDGAKKRGMFILTGSHQPELHQSVSQTLAGRTAVLSLLPFSLSELKNYQEKWEPLELIIHGSYPRLHEEKLQPGRFFNGYLQTYIERDVHALINLKNLTQFHQFLMLLAGRIGQIANYTSLSNDVGVSATTIKNWVSVLKASFIVFELPPFFENIRKRVIKSPKIYFNDVGLAAFLLGIETADQLYRDPLRGGLYENLVILEILKSRLNRGKRPELFFYRDTHGNEVDLVIRQARTLIPLEIKSAATFTSDFLKNIDHFGSVVGDRCAQGFVLYNGQEQYTLKGTRVINPILHGGIEGL